MASSALKGTKMTLQKAVAAISSAKALIITAGAGMGVDSGLPDFRGAEGFWNAYPPLRHLNVDFPSMSNPQWFRNDPERAWGFFGHRYNLYTKTSPHEGFDILKKWADAMENGYFIFTSNVDGHFQKAGFPEDRVIECHGSINFHQCVDSDQSLKIWPVQEDFRIDVDMATLKATTPLPKGPPGDAENPQLSRPNILMFGDYDWISDRTDGQEENMSTFKETSLHDDYVIIEIGAGLAVPTVRYTSESLIRRSSKNPGTLIRINPTEPQVPQGQLSLKMKALDALKELDVMISSK